MDDVAELQAGTTSGFELAPPRRFVLPAILLMLSEQSDYGYGLVPRLEELRFGHVDRPAVYRALALLERNGLVEAQRDISGASRSRRIYEVTALGERVLRRWMGVIKEEHNYLSDVLRRYQATGTVDAVLAEVDGAWASTLGFGWSPVSSSTNAVRRLVSVDEANPLAEGDLAPSVSGDAAPVRIYRVVPERSVILIEVRSTVGPIGFGCIDVSGWVSAAVVDGAVVSGRSPTAHGPTARLEIAMSKISSGNRLYDAELLRRIDARRFPTAVVELRQCDASGPGSRYRLVGDVTFHGVSRVAQGTVNVKPVADGRLMITGEQVFDIRDFAIPSPTMLMLRIYPDVRVRLHAEAEVVEDSS